MASRSASDALRYDAVRAPFDGWSLVEVTGRHRERFLQSQLTSDLRSLAEGQSQMSCLLDTSGRLRSMGFVQRGVDAFRLLVPADAVSQTIDGLAANIVADDVSLSVVETDPMTLILGPASVEEAERAPDGTGMPVAGWGTVGWVRWRGPRPELQEVPADELEARRTLGGPPTWGVEAEAGMLVNETALLDVAVSFSKGCFLGQETVTKVASRRGAAFAPVLLELVSSCHDLKTFVGQAFSTADRKKAGVVRSIARWNGSDYLQASLWRDLRVAGRSVDIEFSNKRRIEARVVPLPALRVPGPEEMADALHLEAVRMFQADREEEAVSLLQRAIVVCPGWADAYESLGVILGRHGRYEEAIALMDRLLEVAPDSVMAHTNKSVYFNQLGRIEEAEEEARAAAVKSMERRRRDDEARKLGGRRSDEEDTDRRRREEMFRQVLEIDPDDALANFGLGQLWLETGRAAEAVNHLERAVEKDPDYSAAYLALGNALEAVDDLTRAAETYSAGIEVAARRGDMKAANSMQERLAIMKESSTAPGV